MKRLYLDDHGTDTERFVSRMLLLEARKPEAFEAVKLVMRVFVGEAELIAGERARFVAALREYAPEQPELWENIDRQLAAAGAS